MKKIGLWLSAVGLIALQSCSVNTETTYYKDSASSMESNILMDKGMLSMMNMMSGDQSKPAALSKLSTDWKSFYDIQKDNLLTLNKDSTKVLQKMFVKLNKDKGEIYGVSLKYDKLLPQEVTSLLSQSKELKRLPLQNIAKWNGNTLTIDTDKFNSASFLNTIEENAEQKEIKNPKTKSDSIEAYGRQMAQSVMGMMKMFPVNFSSTIKFQKPIKSIVGKHDFVKQIDKKTIQINVRSDDLLDDGKKLTNKDKKIIVTTE
ncbi:hypothetical protein [Kaistella treverensis]|nr:hypothetical protein [Kaistella treverensis]